MCSADVLVSDKGFGKLGHTSLFGVAIIAF